MFIGLFDSRLRQSFFVRSFAGVLISVLWFASQASHAASPAENFYKGKTISYLVSSKPGGTFGLYAQVFRQHFSRHMVGNPNVIVRFMPGGGGLTMFNHLYNVAPKDGTVIGNTLATLPALQIFRPNAARYDALKFNWLGSISKDIYVLSVRSNAPATTLQSLKTKEVPIGSIGEGNPTYYFPALTNKLLGTKLRIITGYPGGSAIYKAMESGEVDGYAPVWLSISTVKADWLRTGKVTLLLQGGPTRMRQLPNVPTLVELVKTPEQRQMALFLAAWAPIGRAVAAPPGVPVDHLAALEKAFAETVNDPAFVADMKKRKLTVEPSTKEEIVAAVRQVMQTPASLINELKPVFEKK